MSIVTKSVKSAKRRIAVEQMRHTETTFADLPRTCFVVCPTSGKGVMVARGQAGFYPSRVELNAQEVREINELRGITPAQEKAMLAGSMFGWDKAVADPRTYEQKPKIDLEKLKESLA